MVFAPTRPEILPSLQPEAAADARLAEDLCALQAEVLGMGDDNYARLQRVCPDPQRRYRVLLGRVAHQTRLALAGTLPPWRSPPRPAIDPSALATAARDVTLQLTTVDPSERAAADAFSPGPPVDAERCWRCDARPSDSELGLCWPCHSVLASR